MRVTSFLTRSCHITFGILLTGCLVLGGAKPAAAAVIYDFSLDANGEVGAINLQLTFPAFLPEGPLAVFDLDAPEVTAYSSGTPIDPTSSVVGIDVRAASTLIGFFLSSVAGEGVLYTFEYPDDFFVFGRTPTQVGTFLSMAGTVTSDLPLDTATPTATLVVTSVVPEPASVALFGLGAVGMAAWRRLRRTSD